MLYKRLVLFLTLFFLTFTLYGFNFESYGIRGGVMYIRNTHEDSAPSPVLPFIGANVGFSFGRFSFIEPAVEPSITFTRSEHFWAEDLQMALPAEIEYADAIRFLNIVLDCPLIIKFTLKENIALGVFAGPAIIIRVPLKAWGEGDSHRADMLSYFYGERFFYAEVGVLFDWVYSPRHSFKARLDALLPVDQLAIRASVTFSFMTKSAQQRRAALAQASTTIDTDTTQE
ncbi:MAG: hypothetical protein FWD87_07450 [Spirochaetaceae bacterium]|nr:hypothetical protein [Spirochaetaceae bacterium]